MKPVKMPEPIPNLDNLKNYVEKLLMVDFNGREYFNNNKKLWTPTQKNAADANKTQTASQTRTGNGFARIAQ